MARSAKMTIVEAEEIVPVGTFDPDHVHLPGVLWVAQSLSPSIWLLMAAFASSQRQPSRSIFHSQTSRGRSFERRWNFWWT